MIATKTLTCKHCPFAVTLTTKIKPEWGEKDDISGGFASHTGWTALRDHVQKAHPEYSAQLAEWIYGSTDYKMPWETNEAAANKMLERCGTEEAA